MACLASCAAVQNGRYRDFLTVNIQAWTPSGEILEHGGYLEWGSVPTSLKLYQGTTLIHENPYASDLQFVEVPGGGGWLGPEVLGPALVVSLGFVRLGAMIDLGRSAGRRGVLTALTRCAICSAWSAFSVLSARQNSAMAVPR